VITGLARLAGSAAPPPAALAEIALRLGADVPYFLRPTPAFVRGIGERIEPLEGLPALSLLLANPGISVATAEVYRVAAALRHSLTDPGAGSTMRALSELRGEIGRWPPALGVLLQNDLEAAAIRLCPPVGRLLAHLRETGALGVGMSGSGGTVFGVYRSSVEAEQAAERLRGEGTATSRAAAATMEATRESEREPASTGDERQEAIRAGAGPAAWLRVCSTPSSDSSTR
jgi:4-diphosphocytidyl-2-C-methyl-D-erythritol kinase